MDKTMTPLREYRKAKKLTLHQLSKTVGVSEAQLSRIERFGTTSLDRALSLAAHTGLRPEDFRETHAGRVAPALEGD